MRFLSVADNTNAGKSMGNIWFSPLPEAVLTLKEVRKDWISYVRQQKTSAGFQEHTPDAHCLVMAAPYFLGQKMVALFSGNSLISQQNTDYKIDHCHQF